MGYQIESDSIMGSHGKRTALAVAPANCIAESFEVAHAVFFTVFTGTEVATNKNAYMLPRGNLFEGFGRADKLSILISWGVVSHSIDIDMIDMTEIRWVDQRVRPYY